MRILSGARSMRNALVAAGMSALLSATVLSSPAFADSRNVATYGVDLSAEQQAQVSRFFGSGATNAEVIYVNNDQERQYLSAYIPLEQIGDKTYSCALVQPTTSGGIHVKTANLTYVTSDMIAATLATSGVKNCDVVAICPFKVSGTGALTGVLMAYEKASGIELDVQKKDLANQELITTGTLAESVGPDVATLIVNDVKANIIKNDITEVTDIDNTVTNVVNNIINDYSTNINNTTVDNSTTNIDASSDLQLSDDEMQALRDFAHALAEGDYSYDDIKQTLEMVSKNASEAAGVTDPMAGEAEGTTSGASSAVDASASSDRSSAPKDDVDASTQDVLSEDSILNQTDDTALGTDTVVDSTDLSTIDPAVESRQQAEASATSDASASANVDDPFATLVWDETTSDASATDAPEGAQAGTDAGVSAGAAEPAAPSGTPSIPVNPTVDSSSQTAAPVDSTPLAGTQMTDTLGLLSTVSGSDVTLSLDRCMVATNLIEGTNAPLLVYEGEDGLFGIMDAAGSHLTDALYEKDGIEGLGDGWVLAREPSGTTDVYHVAPSATSAAAAAAAGNVTQATGTASAGVTGASATASPAALPAQLAVLASFEGISAAQAQGGYANIQDAQGVVSACNSKGLVPDVTPASVDDFSYVPQESLAADSMAEDPSSPAAEGVTDDPLAEEGTGMEPALPVDAIALEGTRDILWTVTDAEGKTCVLDAAGTDLLGVGFDSVEASPDGSWLLVTSTDAHESALYRVKVTLPA